MTPSTLTRGAPAPEPARRPSYRPYRVRVTAVRRLSPSFVRVTVTSEDLRWFGTDGLDQRIKVVLPLPGPVRGTDSVDAEGFAEFGAQDPATIDAGTWYQRWRDLPDAARNPVRTYTVRRIDPDARLLDIDMVVHPGAGPAGAWAAQAAPGDTLIVAGPDARSPDSAVGIDFHPGTADHLLLVGDETAVPALASILESQAAARMTSIDVIAEVPRAGDALELARPGAADGADRRLDLRISWASRDEWPGGPAPHGQTLLPRVREWAARPRVADLLGRAQSARGSLEVLEDTDVDQDLLWDSPAAPTGGDFYAWIAGESQAVKDLRRYLVGQCGVDRGRVAFMGYWRLGRPEVG